ncbi:MAG TPA: peptidylprolyl isomerase [Gammaproteobacteria bacterium]|nr:peptidylprolyl isomerase [Gammaproteobacteria bacterium]
MSNEGLEIGPRREVVMHYTVTLDDGTVADTSRDDDPLSFVVGDGSLIDSLERKLYGLRAGDKRDFRLGPHEAFGFSDLDNIHRLPRADFPGDLPLEPGTIIGFDTPSGEEVPGTIQALEDDTVVVDFNHPLAGYEITFDVEIIEVREAAGGHEP